MGRTSKPSAWAGMPKLNSPAKGRFCRVWVVVFSLGVLCFTPSKSESADEAGRVYIDEQLQMDLADHFFKEGDYYRAVTEYKRFLFFFPQSTQAEGVLFKVAKAYYNGKKWDEAITFCDNLLRKFPLSPLKADALLLKGYSCLEKKEFAQARHFFRLVVEDFPDTPAGDEGQRQIALTYVKEDKWKEAAAEFRKTEPRSKLYQSSQRFAEGLERLDEVPQKSPETAGILAALLPGAGHFYVGRYRDASVAFVLNGAFIWGAVEAFQHKNYAVGGILTFFELGWYSGNVYSADSSAHKYNKKTRQEYLDKLERGGPFSSGPLPQSSNSVIALEIRF